MSRLLTPVRVEAAAWALICGGLLVAVGAQTDWGREWGRPTTTIDNSAQAITAPELTQPFRLRPVDAFIEIALRPVFVATRLPAPLAPAAEAAKPSMKKDVYVLAGTTIGSSGKFAHLVEKAGNKSHVVAEGKEINGILVKAVFPDYVILTQYDDTDRLVLRTAKSPQRPLAPSANAQAPGLLVENPRAPRKGAAEGGAEGRGTGQSSDAAVSGEKQ